MKRYDDYKRSVRLVASFTIIIILTAIYMGFWFKLISPSTGVWYWRKGNWVIAALYMVLLIFFGTMYGGFRLGDLEKGNVIYSHVLSIIIVNFITYAQHSLLAYEFPVIWIWGALIVCDVVAIVLWANVYATVYQRMFPPRRLLMVYGNENALKLVEKLNTRKDRYNVENIISITAGEKEIVSMAKGYDGIILNDIPTASRNYILKECFQRSIRVYMTPKISDILVRSSKEMHTFDTPLLLSHNNGLTLEQQLGKRCLDIMISVLLLAITSPVMLIAALAVKLYDGGSVIYKQTRLTKDGKEFFVYKFRSMRPDAEKDGVARLACENDERITPVGKCIRMTRIDELPQLINVLRGDMSLVGPRPERPEIAHEYEQWLPQFGSRLKVKAGLTGYAQIYGKYNTTPYDKLKLDLIYIQSYSFILDLKLLLLTAKILFMKESTEGVVYEKKRGGRDMRKLRVLQLGKQYYPHIGGIEATMQQIAEGIQGEVESYVLVSQSKGGRREAFIHGVPVCYAKSWGIISSLPISWDIVRYLCRHAAEYDVIHLHMPFPLGDLACLLSGYKGKLVLYWHSDIVRQKKAMFFYKPLMNWVLRRADAIAIATQGNIDGSPYVKAFENKCVLIPFGLRKDWEEKSDCFWSERKKEAIPATGLRLLFIGRFVYYKGCDVLMKAMERIKHDFKQDIKEIELCMIGDGEIAQDLKTWAERAGLEGVIRFRGKVSDEILEREIRECDVLVFPSVANSEAFGLVQLEAMAYGKPVINTLLPTGVPWVSLNGETGLSVAPGDADALAKAIMWMKTYPKERWEMGERARKRVKTQFSQEQMLNRIVKLYKDLCGQS